MAKAKAMTTDTFKKKPKVKGVQAKTKQSKNKKSKLYVKPYRGQGR